MSDINNQLDQIVTDIWDGAITDGRGSAWNAKGLAQAKTAIQALIDQAYQQGRIDEKEIDQLQDAITNYKSAPKTPNLESKRDKEQL